MLAGEPLWDPQEDSDFTERWYERLPAFYRDADTSTQLRRYLQLLGTSGTEAVQVARAADAGELTDPATTPDALVVWLAQMAGVSTAAPVSVDELRQRVTTTRSAGTAASMVPVVQQFLTGDRWVAIRPHQGTEGGDPWIIGVFVRLSEAPSDLEVIRAALWDAGVKPAGYGVDVTAVTVTWEQVDALGPTWSDIDQVATTWVDIDAAAWQNP